MTPVPRAPDYIAGLISLRGQIVTAIDLRRRLGMEERIPRCDPMSVILNTQDGPISLLVDDIGDVLEVPAHSFEPPPENLAISIARYVKGIHKLPGALLAVLDADLVTGHTGGES